jgi:DNA recombination protein RmuC
LRKSEVAAAEARGRAGAEWAAAEAQTRLEQLQKTEQSLQAANIARDSLNREIATLQSRVAELSTALDAERAQTREKLEILNRAREQLTNEFKALASEILEAKTKAFNEQSQASLGSLLTPLKDQIIQFKAKVEEVYVNEAKDRSALTQQVKHLLDLNQSLSQEARNLTAALTGNRKLQGTWGELLLEDVLERAGLRRGQHYDTQTSSRSEDSQTRSVPDVVIHLPGNRHIIVDSKFTLPDYRLFVTEEDEEQKKAALKRHLNSIRTHIKGLSERNYQSLYGLPSIDFVVMFIPLEPAFMVAATEDPEVFQFAWERNVLLVSPCTILFILRTVAYLWRQEELSRNVKEISERGGKLYDKLADFVADLEKIGERLDQAQASYQSAKKKLSEGRGNVMRQAAMLRELGVKPTKQMPADFAPAELEDAAPRTVSDTQMLMPGSED